MLAVLETVRPEGAPWPPPDWLRLLFRGEGAPLDLMRAIVRAAPDEAAPWLAAIVDEDDLAREDAPGGGDAPRWAALALQAAPGPVGIDALVRAVVRTDAGEMLQDAALETLSGLGEAAIEALFAAWASYPLESDERFTVIDALTGWPVKHPLIREALLATLAEDAELGSELCGESDDPELVPPLRAQWDAHEVDEADPESRGNGVAVQVAWALLDLDAPWTEADDAKLSRLLELTGLGALRDADDGDEGDDDGDGSDGDPDARDDLREDLRAVLDDAGRLRRPDGTPLVASEFEEAPPDALVGREAPGRNDPCWCGSGRKYKKCHLDADGA